MFEIKGNPQLNKDSFTFSENGKYPYFTRTVFNNGIAGYVDYLNEENKIADKLTIKKLVEELNSQEQEIVMLRYYKGQTQTEVAKKLGISQVQVSRIEKRILYSMKQKLVI